MPRCLAVRAFAVALGVLAAAPVVGHDLWLIPATFRPAPGQAVKIEVRIGEVFPESMNAPRAKLSRFAVVGTTASTDVTGAQTEGKVLAASIVAPSAGTAAIVLEGEPSNIVLPAEQFKDYLLHEGLAHIHARRQEQGEADTPGREDYSRHAKALLHAGPGPGVATTPLGLTLELVPSVDPYGLAPGEPLEVTALFRGRPLPGLELRAYTAGGEVRRETTGADGTARLRFDRAGPWCVAFIHMERCGDCSAADWRSYFGTLTFELAAVAP